MGASTDVAFLSRALKAPKIAALASTLAERARSEGWDYEAYLAAVLSEEVSSRETHGGEHRVEAARFPQVKTLDDFDFSYQRSVKRSVIAHLGQLVAQQTESRGVKGVARLGASPCHPRNR